MDNGAGIVGASNTFVVQPEPLANFQWSTIASPQYKNVPFSTTLTAKDAHGCTITNFNGTANLSGLASGGGTAPSIVISEVFVGVPSVIEFANVFSVNVGRAARGTQRGGL